MLQSNMELESNNSEQSSHEYREDEPAYILFPLGQVFSTQGAMQALMEAGRDIDELLLRHAIGDWGNLPEEDIETNKRALIQGNRIFSAYNFSTGAKIYVITEWDRSCTTLLLPQEY